METQIRYIAIAIDSRTQGKSMGPADLHDGKIYVSKQDAIDFIREEINEGYATHGVVGMFFFDSKCESMSIDNIQTIGFKGDPNINQIQLFN